MKFVHYLMCTRIALLLVGCASSGIALIAYLPAFTSAQPIEITLTNPTKPGIKIKVDQAYLSSTFLGLVRENRKGGEHKMAMLDVSYPSMKPINSNEAKLDQWKGIVFLRNSNNNFVNNFFKARTGKRFKLVKHSINSINKYVLLDTFGMHPSMIKIWSDDIFYYYDGKEEKTDNHFIECQDSSINNSKCSGFIQLNSGLMIEYHIPFLKLPEWREIYSRFRKFSLNIEARGE